MTQMRDKDKAEALSKILDGQLEKFRQTRNIEFKVNVALWTAIVVSGGFLYEHGFRLDNSEELKSYLMVSVGIFLAHVVFWMVPIQYSEDTDNHFIIEYRKKIASLCGYEAPERPLNFFWRLYKPLRKTGFTWILGETFITAILLGALGFALWCEPSSQPMPSVPPITPSTATLPQPTPPSDSRAVE